jgi:hypothetical protein
MEYDLAARVVWSLAALSCYPMWQAWLRNRANSQAQPPLASINQFSCHCYSTWFCYAFFMIPNRSNELLMTTDLMPRNTKFIRLRIYTPNMG